MRPPSPFGLRRASWPTRSWLGGLVVVAMVAMVALLPSGADAQAVATTFAGLQTVVTIEEYVVVIDRAGRETWGRVAALSASELTLVMVESTDGGARIVTTTDTRAFREENVALILRSDPSGRKGSAVYPASWDRVDTLPSATDVMVTLEAGDRRRYRLDQATPDSPTAYAPPGSRGSRGNRTSCASNDRASTTRRERRVDRCAHRSRDRSGADGCCVRACDAGCDAPEPGGMYSMAAGFGAGIGALSGWVIDKLHKGRETVYPVVLAGAVQPAQRSDGVREVLASGPLSGRISSVRRGHDEGSCRHRQRPAAVGSGDGRAGAGGPGSDRAREETRREAWQNIPKDSGSAGSRVPGAVVADVGAGDGFFTVRLREPSARTVGCTRWTRARERSRSFVRASAVERLTNVVVTEGSAWDPRLATATLDAALIVNSYREMTEYRAMLTNLRQALKPDGRSVIIEPISGKRRDQPRDAQTKEHRIGAEHVQQEAREAGFRVAVWRIRFVKRRAAEVPGRRRGLVACSATGPCCHVSVERVCRRKSRAHDGRR